MAIKTGRRYQMATAFLKGRICFIFILLLTATGVIAAPSKNVEGLFILGIPSHSQVQKALQNSQIQKQGVLKKSAPRQDYSEKIDSMVVRFFDGQFLTKENTKTTFLYDSYGNLISEMESEYKDGKWEDIEKKDYSYDSNGNLVSTILYVSKNSEWKPDDKIEYSYDSNNTLIFSICTEIDDYNSSDIKVDYSYDLNGNLISEIKSFGYNNQWDENRKIDYSYDSNGNLISEIESYKSDNQWIEERKIDYLYNSNGNLISQVIYEDELGPIQEFQKDEYSHDSNGNFVSLMFYRWDNEWVNYAKLEIEYDLSVSIENIAFGAASEFSSLGLMQMVNKPTHITSNVDIDMFLYYSPFKTTSLTKKSVASRANASVSINKIQGNFMFTNHLNEPVELIVHALDGKRMSTSFIQPGTNFVDMTGYSVGVYLVSCRINGKQIQSFRIAR